MNEKTHSLVGVATAVALTAVALKNGNTLGPIPVAPLSMLPLSIAGALEADFEIGEHGKKRHPILARILTHRGATHWYIVPIGFILFTYLIATTLQGNDALISVICGALMGWNIGYASHVFIDTFNGKGTPIYGPILPWRVHLMRVTTAYNKKNNKGKNVTVGKWQETGFLVVYLVLLIIQLAYELK